MKLQFTTLALSLATYSSNAFSPASLNKQIDVSSTRIRSAVEVTPEAFNNRLEQQREKLNARDATSPSIPKTVSVENRNLWIEK